MQQTPEDMYLTQSSSQLKTIEVDIFLIQIVCAFNSYYIRNTFYGRLPFLIRVACAISALAPDYNQRFSKNVTLYEHKLLRHLCAIAGLTTDNVLLHNLKCYREENLGWVLLHDRENNRLLVIIQSIAQLHNAPLLLRVESTELPSGSTVHTGVYKAAYPLYELLSLYMHSYIEHNFLRGYSILLCGHGFGGSVASLVGAMLLRHITGTFTAENTKVVAFGPFPFAGPGFVYKEHIQIRSYIYRWDVVPRLSLHAFNVARMRKSSKSSDSTSSLSQKALSSYSNTEQIYFIPGEIYLMYPYAQYKVQTIESLDDNIPIMSDNADLKPCVCCKLVSFHDVSELVLSEQAINDHYMYEDALKGFYIS